MINPTLPATYIRSSATAATQEWKPWERTLFRFLFCFFVLLAVPLDPFFWHRLLQLSWKALPFRNLFYLSRYTPRFVSAAIHSGNGFGFSQPEDLLLVSVLAMSGALVWTVMDTKKRAYPDGYYLLRVLLRYRLAIAIVAYGCLQLFPMLEPYPSLSLKNTNYGDLTDWKIAHVSYGVAPSFEIFLGAVQILAGSLLLFRKTASIGAAIVIGFVGNVFLSNLAYGGGEAIYCLYLLSMAAVLAAYDAPRWHQVLVAGKPARPNSYHPAFYNGWKKSTRSLLKTVFALLLLFMGSAAYSLFRKDNFPYPKTPGLKDAAGLYDVRLFTINGKILPYSLTDTLRWQNVVFETWATMSVRMNRPATADLSNTEEIILDDRYRNFESSGSNGRWFYRYTIDSLQQVLRLQNKNANELRDQWTLHYNRPDLNHIILDGFGGNGDSIHVELDKIRKVYLLDESYEIPRNRSVFE